MTWQTLYPALEGGDNLFERFGNIPCLHHLKHGFYVLQVQPFVLLPRYASRTSDRVFDLFSTVSFIYSWNRCAGTGRNVVLDARS